MSNNAPNRGRGNAPGRRLTRLAFAAVLVFGVVAGLGDLGAPPAAEARSPRRYRRHRRPRYTPYMRSMHRRPRNSYIVQAGVTTYARTFWGIAQVAAWRNYAYEHFGVVQLAFAGNHGVRAFTVLQLAAYNSTRYAGGVLLVGGYNHQREAYPMLQVGALNIVTRQFIGGVQVGGFNHVYGHFGGIAQLGGANFIGRDSLMLLQAGLYNEVIGGSTDLLVGAQIGVVNLSEGEVYALSQVGVWNETNDDSVVVLGQIGVVNRVLDGELTTLMQLGVGYNHAKTFMGMAQIAPLNYVEDELFGSQIGVVNLARTVNGVQIGLFNYARKLRGLQLGLICISREGGLPFSVIANVGF